MDLDGYGSSTFSANSGSTYELPSDKNGVLKVSGANEESLFLVDSVRVREVDGKVDFAMPTVVRVVGTGAE